MMAPAFVGHGREPRWRGAASVALIDAGNQGILPLGLWRHSFFQQLDDVAWARQSQALLMLDALFGDDPLPFRPHPSVPNLPFRT